jgi:hypothetical protein
MHVKGTKKAIDARDASTQCNLVLGTNMFKICEARKTVELVEIVVKNGNRFDHHTYTPNEKVLVTPYEPDPQDTK